MFLQFFYNFFFFTLVRVTSIEGNVNPPQIKEVYSFNIIKFTKIDGVKMLLIYLHDDSLVLVL